jgi:hypothetical protein
MNQTATHLTLAPYRPSLLEVAVANAAARSAGNATADTAHVPGFDQLLVVDHTEKIVASAGRLKAQGALASTAREAEIANDASAARISRPEEATYVSTKYAKLSHDPDTRNAASKYVEWSIYGSVNPDIFLINKHNL